MHGIREALDYSLLHLAVAGEDDERFAGSEEVVDPAKRAVELAAAGEPLQHAELGEPFGAQRCRDLGVELAEVERLVAQPGDDVGLSLAVFGAVGQCDRHDAAAFGGKLGQHVCFDAAQEAVAAKVPMEPLLAARMVGAEAASELRAGAEVVEPADHAQLRDQLLGMVEHRRTGQCQAQPVIRNDARQPAHSLRPFRARVLAVMRLVDDQRLRAATR